MQQGVQGNCVPLPASMGAAQAVHKSQQGVQGTQTPSGGWCAPAGARGVPASSILHSSAAGGGTRKAPE